MTYLVTGAAGFIGSHLAEALLQRGERVIGLDNFNPYYDPARKRRNVAGLLQHQRFTLVEGDLRDAELLDSLVQSERPTHIAHLAAMAGPRPSARQPALYEAVNVAGTLHLLSAAARCQVKGLVLASTSSVYGLSPTPWREDTPTDRPLSPYAATKKAAEVLAFTYHYQHGMPTRVVRFFTVYGPRGRPDMTPYLFVDKMVRGEPITLFNGGHGVYRDWTYVDDIVRGVLGALDSELEFEIFNLGNSQPVELRQFVTLLERITGRAAQIEEQPLPAADPPITYANIDKAQRLLGFQPQTPMEEGLERFWHWYQSEVEPRANGGSPAATSRPSPAKT